MAHRLLADRYRLESEIGAGGMGRVWRAQDVRLDREVAVKTVDLAGATDPAVAERFRREIILTAKLASPYTVTVFDGGLDGRTAYLVMELLRGESLADAIARRGPLGLGQTLDVARQVVLGLAAAHAVGLVHRDIKPANVMLGGSGVKLLDFGIAQLTGQADAHLTQPSVTIGTAAYMSPEQAAGRRVEAATDLYALGCLIMTMYTGRPPFDGDQPVLVAADQINATPPRLRSRRADAPPGLDELVARLLAKNPLERPDTAATLQALDQLRADPSAPTVALAAPPQPTRVPPSAPTRPYTQVAQPSPAAKALDKLPRPGPAWIAGILLSLMAAILAGGVAFSLTGQGLSQIGTPSGRSSTSAKPSAGKSTSAKPKATQSTSRVALATALEGVRLALSALPDSAAKADLLERWKSSRAAIAAGQRPATTLTTFETAVKRSKLAGWERQAVLTATGAVRLLL